MLMNITGIIIQKLPAQSGTSQRSGNTWTKQVFVIETQEQYPKRIAFEVFNNQVVMDGLNALPSNVPVTIHFDINANEYQGKWYNQIRCWKYEQVGDSQQAPPQQPATTQQPQGQKFPPTVDSNGNTTDEPPF